MRESESFDAFYARTVSDVTSQMHALAGGDPQADHALREAYARAYQQWYEVSGLRDPAVWVLDVAREAFERRRSQPASTGDSALAPETGTWPGMYRPAGVPQQAGDPDATVTGGARAGGRARAGGWLAGRAQADQYKQDPLPASPYQASPYQRDPFQSHAAQPTAALSGAGGLGEAPGSAGMPDYSSPASPGAGGRARPGQAVGSRPIIAVIAVIAVLAAAAAYLAFGRGHASPSAGLTTPAKAGVAKPRPHMLPAGQEGARSKVPWSLVGPGWTLAQFSTAQPSSGGQVTGGGATTFLVDPEGGKYLIEQWPAGSNPALLAWSGNADSALLHAAGGGYQLLTLTTGQVAQLTLPAGVAAAGFTRPDGLNILAVRQGPVVNKLQRYNLSGAYQATLASNVSRPGQGSLQGSCASAVCGALSSPDGTMAVWGLRGDEMQLVSNAGGMIRRLHVPGSGTPPSCTPVSWWNSDTVLADCTAPSAQFTQLRLWLVPDDGSTPTPLTAASGGPAGDGYFTGAWQAGGQVYATATSSSQCPGAASGPGGLGIAHVSQAGSPTPVTISGSTNNYTVVVGSARGRLLVLAQTSCPGTSSLLWLDPSSGATQTVLTAPASEAGVTAAVPFGSGPTATVTPFSGTG